jgi:hypothetical protein
VEYVVIVLGIAMAVMAVMWIRQSLHSGRVVDALLKERKELKRELCNRPLASKVEEMMRTARIQGLDEGYRAGFADGKAVARRAVARAASQQALANFDKLVK